jgi:hypothetical protein
MKAKMKSHNNQPMQVIAAGAELCKKIKDVFYPGVDWDGDVSKNVSKIYQQIKKNVQPYHPEVDEVSLIRILVRYSDKDLKEALALNSV